MNRLLLQEWLDELRSDDSVELTESQKHPHGKKRNSPHHGNRAAPSLDGSSRGFPDSSRSTASSTPALTERRRQSIANVTNDVKRKILNYLNGDRKIDEKDYKRAIGDLRATFSLEYKGGSSYGPIATPSGIMGLRVADHRAVGEHFPQNEGDFYVSIYIGEGEAAHIPTAVPYKEFYCPKVLFDRNPKKVLRAAVGIVLNAIETGELVDKTATFTMKDYPVEVPQGAQAAIPTQAGLSPQPPATPPTGPGVQESLVAKYFKEAHNMKFRLLKEAALQELKEMEENAWGEKLYPFRYFYSPATMRESGALRDEPLSPDGYCIYVWGETEDSARAEAEEKLYKRFGERPIAMYSEEEWEAMETGADCYKKTTPPQE